MKSIILLGLLGLLELLGPLGLGAAFVHPPRGLPACCEPRARPASGHRAAGSPPRGARPTWPAAMCSRGPARGERGYKRTRVGNALRRLLGRPAEASAEALVDASASVPTSAPAAKIADQAPAPASLRWSVAQLEELSRAELAKVRAATGDPPNPAEALRASGDGALVLDEMQLACCWLHHEGPGGALPLPRFRVTARPSRILEPELRQMAIVLRAALDREQPFTILWDLRQLRPPALAALAYGSKWQSENAADVRARARRCVPAHHSD